MSNNREKLKEARAKRRAARVKKRGKHDPVNILEKQGMGGGRGTFRPSDDSILRLWNWFTPSNPSALSSAERYGMYTQASMLEHLQRNCATDSYKKLKAAEQDNPLVHSCLDLKKAKTGLKIFWVAITSIWAISLAVSGLLYSILISVIQNSQELKSALEMNLVQKVQAVGGDKSLVLADETHKVLPPGSFHDIAPVSSTFTGPYFYEQGNYLTFPVDFGFLLDQYMGFYVAWACAVVMLAFMGFRAIANKRGHYASTAWLTKPMKIGYISACLLAIIPPVLAVTILNI